MFKKRGVIFLLVLISIFFLKSNVSYALCEVNYTFYQGIPKEVNLYYYSPFNLTVTNIEPDGKYKLRFDTVGDPNSKSNTSPSYLFGWNRDITTTLNYYISSPSIKEINLCFEKEFLEKLNLNQQEIVTFNGRDYNMRLTYLNEIDSTYAYQININGESYYASSFREPIIIGDNGDYIVGVQYFTSKLGTQAVTLAFRKHTEFPIDNQPPARTNLNPQGTIYPYGMTQETISLNTDGAVNCKYSTQPNINYYNMIMSLTTRGCGGAPDGTLSCTHSATITGLSSGTYNYYIKCRDPVGNVNTDDAHIYFTISQPTPTIDPPGGSPTYRKVTKSPEQDSSNFFWIIFFVQSALIAAIFYGISKKINHIGKKKK